MKQEKTEGEGTSPSMDRAASDSGNGSGPEYSEHQELGASDGKQVEPEGGTMVEVLTALRLRGDDTTSFHVAGQDAVQLPAVLKEVPKYIKAMYSARGRIARRAKVKSESLPILISISGGQIVLSIVTPQGKDGSLIVAQTKELCDAIMKHWRVTTESARDVLSGAGVPVGSAGPAQAKGEGDEIGGIDTSSTSGAVSPTDSGKDQPAASAPPVQVDPLGRYLMEALMAPEREGSLLLNFGPAGQADERPAIIVPPAPPTPVASISLGEPREVVAQVCHRTGAAACLVREPDVSKQRKASFGTTDRLSTIINMLIGCPAVLFEVQDCKSDQPQVKPTHDYIIKRLVGLTPPWWDEPSVLDYLQSCLDELRALVIASRGAAQG